MKFKPRKIDQEALNETRIKRIAGTYRPEIQRRRKIDEEIPTPKWRQAGETDITDIPTNMPWQKLYLDELGKAYPLNTNFVCPKCGLVHCSSFPFPTCPRCGMESIINDMNLRD